MKLDFLEKLNQYIKVQKLDSSTNKALDSKLGLLEKGESMSIMAMPGGAENIYMDGTRDKVYNVQINVKSQRNDVCMNALNVIAKKLERLTTLQSSNDSYEFQQIRITSNPSFLHQDDKGFFVWVLSISAELTIFEGVED